MSQDNYSDSNVDDSDDENLIGYEDEFIDDEYESGNEDVDKQANSKVKRRGPTMMHHIHTRVLEKRKVVILNEFGQPIGPVTEEGDVAGEYSRFLGTIACDYSFAPLTIKSWHKVPNKDKMWEYVLMKYIIPIEGKEWTLKSIGDAWRVYKCRFKNKHYHKWNNNQERWKNRPKRLFDDEFKKLLAMWKVKDEKIRCSKNKERRLSQKNMHTVGPKGFARVRDQMEPPSLAEFFERTRRRTEGKVYKDSFDDTKEKIDAMKNFIPPENENVSTYAFFAVMGKEYDGRCRLYGRGVTSKKLKKASNLNKSYIVSGEFMASLKSTVIEEIKEDMGDEMTKLHDMRREIEKEQMKKNEELEAMQRNLDNERNNMFEDVMRKVLERLPTDIAKQYLL